MISNQLNWPDNLVQLDRNESRDRVFGAPGGLRAGWGSSRNPQIGRRGLAGYPSAALKAMTAGATALCYTTNCWQALCSCKL